MVARSDGSAAWSSVLRRAANRDDARRLAFANSIAENQGRPEALALASRYGCSSGPLLGGGTSRIRVEFLSTGQGNAKQQAGVPAWRFLNAS